MASYDEPAGTCSCNGSPGNWGFHPRKDYFEGMGNTLLCISAILSIPSCMMGYANVLTLIGCILVAQELEEEKQMVGKPMMAAPGQVAPQYGAAPAQARQ